MEAVHHLIKVTVPSYFRSLPIPKSVDGFAKLNCKYRYDYHNGHYSTHEIGNKITTINLCTSSSSSSSHGENGSRPQRPLYPRNNDKVHFILHKILYYNITVSDAMEICFVIIHHVLIDPEFI